VRVLDPACGSGNFLIVSLWALKDLEYEAIQWGSLVLRRPMQLPQIGPEAVLGIEINAYAAELARVTVWIGEIQWMIRHGLGYRRDPILRPLHHIETRDALLDLSDPANPREAEWPEAEFIVGNPPFLGDKFQLRVLGAEYAATLRSTYLGRVKGQADLCCYFHERARQAIADGQTRRAGLLATQAIRHGASRLTVDRIAESGGIFFARSDDPWVLAGANVHISFVGQDDGSELERELDGHRVSSINPNLTSGIDLTAALRLPENAGVAFQGPVKVGPFDISHAQANELRASPNPDGRSNADVVRPWINGLDVARRPRDMWIIDFAELPAAEAALYEAPFEYVREHVKPIRDRGRRARRTENWWMHGETVPGLRAALAGCSRYIATVRVSKHRLFVWVPVQTLPDSRLVAIALDDDFSMGVLHSRVHELWARATGSQLREVESGFAYTPTTCFETFPFPDPNKEQRVRVGEAARCLVELRDGWLNPPGLAAEELAKRTLTNLYNQRPTWLTNAHSDLDSNVIEAYGWPVELSDDLMLAYLLATNNERAERARLSEERLSVR
jgi:type II restriction/modification system DNA methylase subunit YeeA